jgi:hypothetical protein
VKYCATCLNPNISLRRVGRRVRRTAAESGAATQTTARKAQLSSRCVSSAQSQQGPVCEAPNHPTSVSGVQVVCRKVQPLIECATVAHCDPPKARGPSNGKFLHRIRRGYNAVRQLGRSARREIAQSLNAARQDGLKAHPVCCLEPRPLWIGLHWCAIA